METTRGGLPAIGDLRWGTHFCHFYHTADDLADSLVPFFKAGIENNEQCLWVTSEPFGRDRAVAALRAAVPDLDRRLKQGQIEIIDFSDCYPRRGQQDAEAVLNGWLARKEQALARGYAGLRVSDNTCWIETREQWRDFADYEAKVNACFGDHRILALCSYHLDRCSAADTIEIVRNHQFALIRQFGEWEVIENASLKQAKDELRQANEELERRVAERTAQLHDSEQRVRSLLEALPAAIYTTDAAGRITYYNQAAVDLAGRRPALGSDEWCVTWRLYRPDGTPLPHDECPMAVALNENRPVRGEEAVAERPDGARTPFLPYPTPLRDASGAVVGAVNMLVDITERKRAEALIDCQRRALQLLAEGSSLDDVLGFLLRMAERHAANGMLGSILLLNEAGTHFERGIGPSLPPAFNAAVAGVAVDSAIGVCCRAVSRREPVVVSDFSADPQWAQFVEFVAPYDLRAGWSMPIFGSGDKVLGTFANYYRQPCDPQPRDLEWVEIVTRTAAIAIERDHADAALRRSQENLAAELAATQRLQDFSAELIHEQGIEALYDKLVEAAGVIMRSDFASMQLFYPERGSGGALRLLAFRGFNPQAAKAWEWVSAGSETSCGAALRAGKRVIVPDLAHCAFMAGTESLAAYLQTGIHAAQSTPLVSRAGCLLGMISTHWREPHEPTDHELRLLDVLARQAADLVERAHADAALRQSRENLTAAMAASDTGTFRWNPHTGEFLEFDDNLKRLFGFASDQPVRVTEDFIARVHPDDIAALVTAVEACRRGADFSMEYRVVLPDGGLRWLYDRARMERDGEGRPSYLIGACTDITKRKEAENRVYESEGLFRTLADSIPLLAWMADPDGWIFWYNRGWYEYTGTTPADMEGWGWQSVHDPEVLPGVLERWRASIATGTPFEMVFPLKGADGAFRPFLTRIVPMRDAGGRITRWFGTNTDIAGQREIQDTLHRLTEMLERQLEERTQALELEMAERRKIEAALHQAQRLEAIGQLTGGVAHDFNNLLTVVIGQAESIIMAAGGNERIIRMATSAQRVAERGAQLTSQLLAFARRQHLRPEIVLVHRLISPIAELVQHTVGESTSVKINTDPQLWPLLADLAQFEAALLNLAVNARDAMPEGGQLGIAARNVTVAPGEAQRLDISAGEYVAVSVADNGCGMPPDIQQRCFEPFFTTKDIGKGTGLGLSQIYGFARQSGGTATVDSKPGGGTTVTLYLPRAEGEAIENASVPTEAAVPNGHGKTVLLVEDQIEVRELMETWLTDLDYRIIAAPDGVEARRLLDSGEQIDLLLTDIVMPNGVSGLDLAQSARRRRPGLKTILVSGYSRRSALPDDEREFIFLEKPFRQAELAAKISDALK